MRVHDLITSLVILFSAKARGSDPLRDLIHLTNVLTANVGLSNRCAIPVLTFISSKSKIATPVVSLPVPAYNTCLV
jgi:hypothetical protein